MPVVKRIATFIYYKNIVTDIQYEDCYQFGMVGLLEAIDRYRMDGRAVFSTYATYRIKGAIYSGLAKLTEDRAQYDFKSKIVQSRIDSLRTDHDSDFADIINLTLSLALGYLVNVGYHTDKSAYFSENNPYKNNEMDMLRQELSACVDSLPEKESLVITYHYYNNVSFEEIGDILDLSKGRISQLHKTALTRIQKKLKISGKLNNVF